MSKRKIEVVDYDPGWITLFQDEVTTLKEALGTLIVSAHHIGSTAVPGLAAKPIIDILLEVSDVHALNACSNAMRAIGFEPRGEYGINGRRYFEKGGNARSHHLHAFEVGNEHIDRHLAYRDYLRANPDVASEYARLKCRIAKECNNNSTVYGEGKSAFVQHHERLALVQYANVKDERRQVHGP